MPIYVIHIGPPKVGSKYLQTSLAALSEELSAQGVMYPTNFLSTTRKVWHQVLGELLKSGRNTQLEHAFGALNTSGYRYVVFSYEGLFGLNEEQLAYLKELIAGAPVQVVYYCRRWSERIPSLWKQNVKEGLVETLPETYARAVQEPVKAPDLNPKLVWDKFANVFGRDCLKLVSFNNLVENEVDLVKHFAGEFLGGVTLEGIPTEAITNQSPDILDTEILRALNAIHLRRTGSTSNIVRIRFLEHRKRLETDFLRSLMEKDLGEIVLNDHFQVFELVYQQMDAYTDKLVSPEYGRQFFKRQSIKYAFVRQNYLLNEAVISDLSRLYDSLFQQT